MVNGKEWEEEQVRLDRDWYTYDDEGQVVCASPLPEMHDRFLRNMLTVSGRRRRTQPIRPVGESGEGEGGGNAAEGTKAADSPASAIRELDDLCGCQNANADDS
jgi:hypothetical protein